MRHTYKLVRTAFLGTLILYLTGCGFMAGGELEGTIEPIPANWAGVAKTDVIQLETRPTEPYSVHLWVIGLGHSLYVHAGASRTAWVEHIDADPRVRLQAESAIYELRAERVTDADEFAAFAAAYEVKYGNRPRNEDVTEAYLIRLTPR